MKESGFEIEGGTKGILSPPRKIEGGTCPHVPPGCLAPAAREIRTHCATARKDLMASGSATTTPLNLSVRIIIWFKNVKKGGEVFNKAVFFNS